MHGCQRWSNTDTSQLHRSGLFLHQREDDSSLLDLNLAISFCRREGRQGRAVSIAEMHVCSALRLN